MKIKLTISYFGTPYNGWQKQPNAKSIQQELENAFLNITNKRVSITASGRTDEGVHAIGQIAHFEIDNNYDEKTVQSWLGAFNFYLPASIRVKNISIASDDFHAIASAKKKTYQYDIYFDNENPLLENRAYFLKKKISLDTIRKAAKLFKGTHDFASFRAVGSSATTTVRTIYSCDISNIELYGSSGIRLTVSANGFLYKMVRIIVGSLIQVSLGKLSIDDIKLRLKTTGDMADKVNKPTAPSYGLYLLSVEY